MKMNSAGSKATSQPDDVLDAKNHWGWRYTHVVEDHRVGWTHIHTSDYDTLADEITAALEDDSEMFFF